MSLIGVSRYHAEIGFHLESDFGTEAPQRLRAKAHPGAAAARGHVLWVAPWPPMRADHGQCTRARDGRPPGTSPDHARRAPAPVGTVVLVWQDFGQGERRSLTTLPAAPECVTDRR